MNKNKLLSMAAILACITVIAGGLLRVANQDSMSLTEYMQSNSSPAPDSSQSPLPGETQPPASAVPPSGSVVPPSASEPDVSTAPAPSESLSLLTGASLNGISQLEQRTELAEGFYYEPISDKLRRYMTGISYPAAEKDENAVPPEITFEELCYLHILHYDFHGSPTEGELICNTAIAQDLAEIFYELYCNEYQLEKVLLIDEYDGDDTASMEDNNTSCFNYRTVADSRSLSLHAYGLAVDINPLYNPYISYTEAGTEVIAPVSAQPYADRSAGFPYKIDTDDLCCRLFLQHGFVWGGNWNNVKDYQHFQKSPAQTSASDAAP